MYVLTYSLSNHMTYYLIYLLLSLIEQAQGKSNSMLHYHLVFLQ